MFCIHSSTGTDDQTYDVKVRLAPDARSSPQDLERLPFMAPARNGPMSSRWMC